MSNIPDAVFEEFLIEGEGFNVLTMIVVDLLEIEERGGRVLDQAGEKPGAARHLYKGVALLVWGEASNSMLFDLPP